MADIDARVVDVLIGIHIGMFRTVPGAARLDALLQYHANGLTQRQIAAALAQQYPAEFAAVMPPEWSTPGVAHRLATLMLGDLVHIDDFSWAADWVVRRVEAGFSYSDIVVQAVNALKAATNPAFFAARDQLDNQIAIARIHSLDQRLESANPLEASALIDLVDNTGSSVDDALAYLDAQGSGVALTSGVDVLTAPAFSAYPDYLQGESGYRNTLQNHDVLTGSGAAVTLDAALASWDSQAFERLTPVLQDIVSVRLWVTGNRMAILDFSETSGLRELVLSSNVRLDVHGLRDMLSIDARRMTAELLLFLEMSGQQQGGIDAAPVLRLMTGSGHDNISIRGILNGLVDTGAGSDSVTVQDEGQDSDLAPIAMVLSPAGRLNLVAGDLRASAASAARIVSADGPDFIAVRDLHSAAVSDGSGGYTWLGASIVTGGGDDVLLLRSMADGSRLDTGAGNDRLQISLAGQTVVAGDTDASGRGAEIDMGEGHDEILFLDALDIQQRGTVIFGQGAVLRGVESLRVETLGEVHVTAPDTVGQTEAAVPGLFGVRYLQLAINNEWPEENSVPIHEAIGLERSIDINMRHFASAPEFVGLVSQEMRQPQFSDGKYWYRAGAATTFRVDNLRIESELRLSASEVTAVNTTPEGVFLDDSLLQIRRSDGAALPDPLAKDVTLRLSYDAVQGSADHARLYLGNDIDLDLAIVPGSGGTAPSPMMIEQLSLVIGGGSPSIDLNGFGDVFHRSVAGGAPVRPADVSSPVHTALWLSTQGGGSDVVVVDGVNADTIMLNEGVSTHEREISLVLRVDAANNYLIKTVSGDDILDMRADQLRADDDSTAVDRADRIDMGGGHDLLIVNGDNPLGSNDLDFGHRARSMDDAVFAGLRGIEEILVDTGHGAANSVQTITLDAAAANQGLGTLRFTGVDEHTVLLVLGEQYSHSTPSRAPLPLHIDAAAHQGNFSMVLDSRARAGDEARFDLVIHLNAAGSSATMGPRLQIMDSGDELQRLDLHLTTAGNGLDTRLGGDIGRGAGEVLLDVVTGSIDSIVLVDGASADTLSETSQDHYIIESAWTRRDGAFRFDASALLDTDQDSRTGGVRIDLHDSDATRNEVLGSANDDVMTGSMHPDLIEGLDGDDLIRGGLHADLLLGGAGADTFVYGASDAQGRLLVSAAADSHISLGMYDIIADFESGTDLLRMHFGSNGYAVNLDRFYSVARTEVLDQLPLPALVHVPGAVLYAAAEGILIVDLDGNGVLSAADLFVVSPQPIAATDLEFVVAGTDTSDIVRAGAGRHALSGFAGDDTFVLVGRIDDAARQAFAAAGTAAGIGLHGDIAHVLDYDELLQTRQAGSSAGNVFDGGSGNDMLHTFGAVDLSASSLHGIEWVVQRLDVSYRLSQLGLRYDEGNHSFVAIDGGISGIALYGNLAHRITIMDETGAMLDAGGQARAFRAFLDRPGQQLHVLDGAGSVALSVGNARFEGLEGLLASLAGRLGEATNAAVLGNESPFTGDGGLFAFADPLSGVPPLSFDLGGSHQLLDAGWDSSIITFHGALPDAFGVGNVISRFDAGPGGGLLDFSAVPWIEGGLSSGAGGGWPLAGPIVPFGRIATGEQALINGRLALVNFNYDRTVVDSHDRIAALFSGQGPLVMAANQDSAALVLAGGLDSPLTQLWFVEDGNGDGTLAASEIQLVGQILLRPEDDITSFTADNFLFGS